jgi:hypothetical protein
MKSKACSITRLFFIFLAAGCATQRPWDPDMISRINIQMFESAKSENAPIDYHRIIEGLLADRLVQRGYAVNPSADVLRAMAPDPDSPDKVEEFVRNGRRASHMLAVHVTAARGLEKRDGYDAGTDVAIRAELWRYPENGSAQKVDGFDSEDCRSSSAGKNFRKSLREAADDIVAKFPKKGEALRVTSTLQPVSRLR